MKRTLIVVVLCMIHVNLPAQDDVQITPETKDGKQIYESWCARCHGVDGSGKVEGLELDTPIPDLADCSFTSGSRAAIGRP